jgi:hypothetical protein
MCRAAFSTFQETILIERCELLRSGYNALVDGARITVRSAHFACRAVMIGIDAIISRGSDMQWMRCIAVLAWLSLSTGPAAAALLTWTVTGGAFNDGGTLSGTFVKDSTSNAVTNWNLSVAGGGAFFPARSYTPSNSTFSSLALSGNPIASSIFSASDEAFRELRLTPVAPLDGSATTVNLDVAFGNGNVECFNCSPFRTISAGTLVLSAASPGVTIDSVIPSPTKVGTTTTVNVTVAGVSALGAPTGTVTVLDSMSSPLCTIALPATSCTFTPANAGPQTLTAQYNGDASYAIALSNVVPLTIQPGAIVETQPVPTIGWPAMVGLVVVMAGLAALKRR